MGADSTAVLGFPLAYAKTQRFSLGVPRSLSIIDDGATVLFLRSVNGTTATLGLWALDVDSGTERLIVDAATLGGDQDELSAEEKARRERARESAGGIVRYAVAQELPLATFVLAGSIYLVNISSGELRSVDSAEPAFDARLCPSGTAIAYVSNNQLRVTTLGSDGQPDRDAAISPTEADTVSWGLAEFVAGEEMGRTRGFWWSPDSDELIACRVDVEAVPVWHIADPANPSVTPTEIRYPRAGSPNADVELHRFALSGGSQQLSWAIEGSDEYLADVVWNSGDPIVVTQSRDQRTTSVLQFADSATPTVLRSITDAHWTELHPGAPRLHDGSLYTIEDLPDRRALCIDGNPVTEKPLQVRSLVSVDEQGALITASLEDPTEIHVVLIPADGWSPETLTTTPGVHSATAAAGTMVIASTDPTSPITTYEVRRAEETRTIRNLCEDPWLRAEPIFLSLGSRHLSSALFLPSDHDGESALPVLLDPYGGPHAQRVLKSHNPHLVSRWFAEQGYAVLVTDGRGTPGRGPAFERMVWGDLAAPVLEDQLDALDAAAAMYPFLDLGRVGIRGWSFGGYLAALAAMRAPERIHAAIAGAPVTDWQLYDTHYTERYLGHPDQHPEHYERSGLLQDVHSLDRPLLLIHGLADDNVVAAHTLQLSSALLAHGRPHRVLPLSGVTHMTPQAVVAQNLLLLQLDFLNEHLTGSANA